jgi:hypothetical protein
VVQEGPTRFYGAGLALLPTSGNRMVLPSAFTPRPGLPPGHSRTCSFATPSLCIQPGATQT